MIGRYFLCCLEGRCNAPAVPGAGYCVVVMGDGVPRYVRFWRVVQGRLTRRWEGCLKHGFRFRDLMVVGFSLVSVSGVRMETKAKQRAWE